MLAINVSAFLKKPALASRIAAFCLIAALATVPFFHGNLSPKLSQAAIGLVAAYGFNESSGTTTQDASGNNNTGQLLGGSAFVVGKYGNGISLNGSNAVVKVPDSPTWKINGLTTYTMSMWIKVKSVSGDYKVAIGSGNWPSNNFNIYKVGGQWHFGVRTSSLTCGGQSTTLPYLTAVDNTYHHIALVLNIPTGKCHFYSDGLLTGTDDYVSGTTSFLSDSANTGLYIGGLNGGQYLNADVDEVRLYTSALTQTEIQTEMNMPIGGGPTPDTTPPIISGILSNNITATSATISWDTDEPSNSKVEYGLTDAYDQSTALNPALTFAHSQDLTGLSSESLYHYRVRSVDGSGNEAVTGDFTFTTTPPQPDTVPPMISAVSATAITSSSAAVTWTTNELSDSQVEYGLTTAYGNNTAPDTTLATGHSQNLFGLSSNTSYHYRVMSRDAASNLSTSGDFVFTTTPSSADFQEVLVTGGLDTPTAMEFAPDGRLFVAEKSGKIRVISTAGQLLSTPFFSAAVASGGEQGMLGVAFDPNFAVNQYVYVFYTATGPTHNRVSRLTANGNVAAAGSETILLDLPSTSSIAHQGGAIHFGTDGKLYIAAGEHQLPEVVQLLDNPFGKILRINSDGSIPADNPFLGQTTGINRAIYAIGLRNPFTFGVDPNTGKIFINDVGYETWEEINELSAGANFGWPLCEGPQNIGLGSCTDSSLTYPLHSYTHSGGDSAVTGGVFYRGTQFPAAFDGVYFFADYSRNWIRYLAIGDQVPGINNPYTDFRTAELPIDLKIGPNGELYYASIGLGEIRKIEYTGINNHNPIAVMSATPASGPVPLQVTFDATGSSDLDNDPLNYVWNFGDGSPQETGLSATHTYQSEGPYTATLTVSDGRGGSDNETKVISAGGLPVAAIITPTENTFFNAGDTVSYSGSATDPEDGTLPASSYSWTIVFHHGTHTHPFQGPITGTASGMFQIPTIGETAPDTWYRIHFTATDSSGLSHEVTRDIFPNLVTLILASSQTGPNLTLDGQPLPAPISTQAIVGQTRSIGATSPQTVGQNQYFFESWSDAGTATHNITVPSIDTTYTANFLVVPPGPITSNWFYPSLQAATTTSSGDNNGFEGIATNLLLNDGLFATDTNSGTGNNTSCTNNGKDRHVVRDFALSLPLGKTTVTGLEVKLDGFADATANVPKFCVRLSWNGGSSWTSAKTTPTLSTLEQDYILGNSTDKWGRSSWTTANLDNTNFRVQVTNVASSTSRDFSLDSVAVRVTAQ